MSAMASTLNVSRTVFCALVSFRRGECVGLLSVSYTHLLDEVAYVRFASVYRQFRDIQTFMDELSKLLRDGEG